MYKSSPGHQTHGCMCRTHMPGIAFHCRLLKARFHVFSSPSHGALLSDQKVHLKSSSAAPELCRMPQDCYVALVGPRELAAGGSVAPALLSTLRQFSGLSTDADDMQVPISPCQALFVCAKHPYDIHRKRSAQPAVFSSTSHNLSSSAANVMGS